MVRGLKVHTRFHNLPQPLEDAQPLFIINACKIKLYGVIQAAGSESTGDIRNNMADGE
jgi:hypothetical protein